MNSFCIFILISLTIANAFDVFIPASKEVIYSWTSDVKAGTFLPARFASQLNSKGRIHIQSNNGSLYIKLTNLTHGLYNGIIDNVYEYEGKHLPVPEEAQDLEKVFRIVYNDNGTVEGIGTQSEEKEFSRNIKKAIASIFQLHSSAIHKKYQHPESFVVYEESIYGGANEVYSVYPQNIKEIEVHKTQIVKNFSDIFFYFVTNGNIENFKRDYEKVLMRDSQKKYLLVEENGFSLVKNIATTGSITYYPQSKGQVIEVTQNFELLDVVSIQERFKIEKEQFEKNLKYHPFVENTRKQFLDGTNGRRTTKSEQALNLIVKDLLKNIVDYFKKDHINTKPDDVKHGQLINRVQRILLRFSVDQLHKLQKTLSEDALNVYYKILPLVGSDASTIYIQQIIIDKVVDEETAVSLLQNFAENLRPTLSLVVKLESLIQLDSTFSWNLRKVAILSFGHLICKAYNYNLTNSSFITDLQKYVDVYINKLRNSTSYYTQMTYLQGLRNMKLPVIAERLIPAFNGEWFQDRNLRYLAISAAAPSIMNSDPNKIITTYWPIFTNRNETSEIRIFCYAHLIMYNPSLSLLRNIATYMLTEPDEEVYHFHYTLLHSLIQLPETALNDLRLNLIQVFKFSPVPRRGVSGANFFGFRDAHYGFNGGVQNYYIKTNESRTYVVSFNTQQNNVQEEEFSVYCKLRDGQDKDPGLLNVLMEIAFKKDLNTINVFNLEVSIVKRDQIINTFSFDKDNLDELRSFLDFFINANTTMSKNFLYVNYRKYVTALAPTDLGITAVYEYLMPEMHHLYINVSREAFENNMRFGIEVSYGSWIQYRHGLSFYNPIDDVWQGIYSYHTYDAALPLHLNISTDILGHITEITWKKHKDPIMNIAGIKTHAHQIVSVSDRDDYELQILNKFLPNGKEFEVVGKGQKFRHNYPLIEEDNLDTGHKLQASIYDSEMVGSHGVFKNAMLRFADPSSKYFNSKETLLTSAWLHFHHALQLLPRPITHGFFIRIEPSEKFSVDQISLKRKVANSDKGDPETFLDIVYSVQNQDKILKTWTLKTSKSKTLNEFKTELTRHVPKEKDWKLCVNDYKEWKHNQVAGWLNITMGKSSDDGCVNDTTINISMTGKRSSDQTQKDHQYRSCQSVVPFSIPEQHSVVCWYSMSSFRHYTYEITTSNVFHDLKSIGQEWWDALKNSFYSYYSHSFEHSQISDNLVKVDVVFPLEEHQIEVNIATSQEKFRFSGIPTRIITAMKILPESTFPLHFLVFYRINKVDRCVVHNDRKSFNSVSKLEIMSNDWTKYSEVNLNSHNILYLKQVNGSIALKLKNDESSLEIIPHGVTYRIISNGTVVPLEDEYHEHGIHYHYYNEDIFVLYFEVNLILVEYQSRGVLIDSNHKYKHSGACYNN